MERDAGLPCILYGEGLRGFPSFPCILCEVGRGTKSENDQVRDQGRIHEAKRDDLRACSVQVHNDGSPLAQTVDLPHAVGAARRWRRVLMRCLVTVRGRAMSRGMSRWDVR